MKGIWTVLSSKGFWAEGLGLKRLPSKLAFKALASWSSSRSAVSALSPETPVTRLALSKTLITPFSLNTL